MKKNILLVLILWLIGIPILAACEKSSSTMIDEINLASLLISADEMPSSSWKMVVPGRSVLIRRFNADMSGVVFFSDLYPDRYSIRENIFLYSSTWDAHRDYEYAIREMGGNDFPLGWKFQSELAEESQISCDDNITGSFTRCYWIARYDRILIELLTRLIPERMALTDIERIVKKIDEKAGLFIFDE